MLHAGICGVYCIPLFELLESRCFMVLLVNVRNVKNVSGHHGHLLKFDGKNWRLKEAAARIAKASADH